MRLYLVQHGEAVPEEKDPKRPLSEEGVRQTERIAAHLKAKKVSVGRIWHSAKARAAETAGILARYLSCSDITERGDINPNDPVDKFPPEIEKAGEDIMIVGHLPFLRKLASLLVAGSEEVEAASFKYSGVLCLEREEAWKIAWFLIPEMV